jgi:hypothetical protein
MPFITRFKKLLAWEPVQWNICQRCGVPVTDGEMELHGDWHRTWEDRAPGDASASGPVTVLTD